MQKKTTRSYPSFSLLRFTVSILALISVLSGCKTFDVKDKPDLLPYMQKPVVFLTIKSPKKLETVWPELMNRMEQRLRVLPALGKVTGIQDRNQKLNDNPKLRALFRKLHGNWKMNLKVLIYYCLILFHFPAPRSVLQMNNGLSD